MKILPFPPKHRPCGRFVPRQREHGKKAKYDRSLPLCPTVLVFSHRAASRQRNNKAQGADSCFLFTQKKKINVLQLFK